MMFILKTICALLVFEAISRQRCFGQQWRKDAYSTLPHIVTAAGYPIEKHLAHTEDGYTLQLFRIPGGRGTKKPSRGKKAVVLVHGLLGSADNFIMMGPTHSLAYILADKGYDVWLANLRGNLFTSHKTLSRAEPDFWEYSIHEHGKYDAPAFVDKILKVTGLAKIMYVGYSMGTSTFFVMTSLRPEYNDKIIAFVALGPAAYLDIVRTPVHYLVNVLDLLSVMQKRGVKFLAFSKPALEMAVSISCRKQQTTDMCIKIVSLIVGEDSEQFLSDITNLFIVRIQPTSLRQLAHYAKISLTGVFTSYEDGINGAIRPYNLTNIRTPVSLWYGGNDQVTAKQDVLKLAQELNKTGTLYIVKEATSWHKFNHLDFLFCKDIATLLNWPLYEHLEELYNKYGQAYINFYF